MSAHRNPGVRSELGRSTPNTILVRGHDLCELLGVLDLGDMAFLELRGRIPTEDESLVFNALLVALVEHGITPSALSSRLTYFGAPEALQGAVAAGLLGVGSRFVGSIEGAARMVQNGLDGGSGEDRAVARAAREIVRRAREQGQQIPGLGHPVHTPVDPRAVRLFELAGEHHIAGAHVALMQAIGIEASRVYAKVLPINATGAIGAIASDMGFSWQVARGLGVMARAIGLVAHILEESEAPIAPDIWRGAVAQFERGDDPG